MYSQIKLQPWAGAFVSRLWLSSKTCLPRDGTRTLHMLCGGLAGALLMFGAAVSQAASISMVPSFVAANPGDTVAIDVVMDFSDQPTLGGGFDIFYDPTALGFVSWVFDPAMLAVSDPTFTRSPDNCAAGLVGGCTQAGELNGIGFGDFAGLSGPLPVGTVTFTVLDPSPVPPGGSTFLTMNDNNTPTGPFFDAASFDEIIVDYNGAEVQVGTTVIPVPPSVWLFASGLIGVVGVARRRRTPGID